MAYKICSALETLSVKYNKNINLMYGLPFWQKRTIRMIEFYTASKYLVAEGSDYEVRDGMVRETRPFYNIVNAMNDVENAAKDIDLKDIEVTSDDNNHYTESFVMTKDVYEWAKKVNFSKILNDMRDTHTRYGSLLVKKVKKEVDGKLVTMIEIPEWKNVITDQVNILKGAIIEIHYMSPAELSEMRDRSWDKKGINKILDAIVENDFNKKIPVYEVRGNFPVSFIKEMDNIGSKKPVKISKKDKRDFTYQLYYMAGQPSDMVEDKDLNAETILGTLTPLYWENKTEKVYKYLARKKRAGRAFGVGVVEEGEEAQVWTNDAIIKQSRAMDYTTKVIGQTASKKLKGRNLLDEVDDGQVLEHEDGKPISPLQLLPSGGLQQYPPIIQQWYAQYEKVTSAYAAQRGENPKSGTAFRLQAAVLQQSNSVFEDLQEEMGIFITEIYNDWIMPDLAKLLNTEHILSHEFSPEELKEIDKSFSLHYANQKAKELVLSKKIVTAEAYDAFITGADEVIKQTKTQRFLQVPKNYYKGWKWKITVNVTGEQKNKAAILESLMTMMTVYSQNPAIATDPVLTQLFMRAVEISGAGISPVSLMGAIQERSKMQLEQMELERTAAAEGGEDTTVTATVEQPQAQAA